MSASRSRSTAAMAGWDTRRSADAEAIANLAPELHALWRRVGGAFRGSPDARAEALEHYAHEHPAEVLAALADAADAKVEALVSRRYPREGRACRRRRCPWRVHAKGLCAVHYRKARKGSR
jgi:hypothetical protein